MTKVKPISLALLNGATVVLFVYWSLIVAGVAMLSDNPMGIAEVLAGIWPTLVAGTLAFASWRLVERHIPASALLGIVGFLFATIRPFGLLGLVS